jgi:hypothetical protein
VAPSGRDSDESLSYRKSHSRAFGRCLKISSGLLARPPCFHAFILDRSLPSGVRGPVDRSHGLTRLAEALKAISPASVR